MMMMMTMILLLLLLFLTLYGIVRLHRPKIPEADDIFDNQKLDIGDNLSEITIPNTQAMSKELNDRKLPEELNFFSGGTVGGNELRFHALQNIRK